jgi:hypothetical protein
MLTVRAKYNSLTPKNTVQLNPYPFRLSDHHIGLIDSIRQKLMNESQAPCSRALAVRRAVEFYEAHLKRIGAEKLSQEIKRATKDTNYAEVVAAVEDVAG